MVSLKCQSNMQLDLDFMDQEMMSYTSGAIVHNFHTHCMNGHP